MKHRTKPRSKPEIHQITVAEIAGEPPASGISNRGARISQQPIDPRENAVVVLQGDLWAINVEPNDCDFHLEISDIGRSVDADRLIVEIPQGPPYLAVRNQLIQTLQSSGVRRSSRIRLERPIRVEVLGFLFYDAWHFSPNNPQRGNKHGSPQVASIWEIHPVFGFIAAH